VVGGGPRRTRVEGRRGIYFRLDARGAARYEICYRDSLGVRRFKVVPGEVDEAQAALDTISARLHRGQRVVGGRITVAELASDWLGRQQHLRPRTMEKYRDAVRLHIVPVIGRENVSDLQAEHVLAVIQAMREKGLSGWTVRGVLTPLSRILNDGVRRGHLHANPVKLLERSERPQVVPSEKRILSRDEIEALLVAALPKYKPLLATACFTGLRLGELLGLVWADVDLEGGFIHVERQLDRTGTRKPPKTPKAIRDVVLMPSLGRLLDSHRQTSPYSRNSDPVFASRVGTPLAYRNVERRGVDFAAQAAGLNQEGKPKLQLHHLRHSYASILIAEGLDIVTVSRQLGHATPSITLAIYAHVFDRARHAETTRQRMEASFGNVIIPVSNGV
jgi:integrase